MPACFYDLHIHSCLSPCGDGLMTPPNIANMAYVNGLDIFAVTDHNSARNLRAVAEAAAELPIVFVPGIEVTAAEELHVVCLFPTLEAAEAAGEEVERLLPPFPNDPEIFGPQQIMLADETVTGEVERLLINATSLSVDDLPDFVKRYGGLCYPAHIDRSSNSLLSAFGCLPEHLALPTVEVYRPQRFLAEEPGRSMTAGRKVVTSSDAHRLEEMHQQDYSIELPECSFAGLRQALGEMAVI